MFDARTKRRKKKLLKQKKYKTATETSGSQLAIAFRRFRKNKAGLLGLTLSICIFLIAIFADVLSPYPPLEPMALYDYSPWYVPPGTVEGAYRIFELSYLPSFTFKDGSFETQGLTPLIGEWNIDPGWEIVNLDDENITGGDGFYAARSTSYTMLSQDITSGEEMDNIDLLFTNLEFSVYLEGQGNTTLTVSFMYEDGSSENINYSIDNNNTWVTKNKKFYTQLNMKMYKKILNPTEIIFVKDPTGSNIIIDNIVLLAGEYFQHYHVLGTNWRSHDLLSKLFYGSRVSLIVSVGAILISMIIGMPLGLIAGYFRGKTDEIIMRITDIFLTLPFYFVMILVIVVLQDTPALDNVINHLRIGAQVIVISVTLGLGIFGWMGITRLVRATILQIREMDYVEAARALGASNKRIMIIHILPNILAPLIVVVTYALAVNIVAEAGLAFLGFTDVSLASWGRELDDGTEIVAVAWWPVLFPALFIIAAVMAFNLLGDGLRDAFDPRLR
ncbi:MAG: ABC transporter permease [Candidatus Thorarchaeota archaeon]